MRTRRLLRGLVVLAVAAALTSCGVVADTTAATIGGETITVERVDEIARNDELMSLLGFMGVAEDSDESRLPGDTARAALSFELQRLAHVQLAEKLGIEPGPEAEQEAERWIAQQEAQVGGSFDADTRDALQSFIGAQFALFDLSRSPQAAEDETLRILYRSHAPRWDRFCVAVVGAPSEALDEVTALRRSGRGVEHIANEVDEAQLVVEPSLGCISRLELPPELADVVETLRPGRTSQAVEMQGAVYVTRLDSTVRVSFEEARPELAAMLQGVEQGGTALLISGELASATVNPRYGSSVSLQGQVLPPTTPLVPAVTLPDLDLDHDHEH